MGGGKAGRDGRGADRHEARHPAWQAAVASPPGRTSATLGFSCVWICALEHAYARAEGRVSPAIASCMLLAAPGTRKPLPMPEPLRCLQTSATIAACTPPALPHATMTPYLLPADKHLELIARLMGWFNAVVATYRRAKAWALSQGALALAILVLVVAVLLRLVGWI